MSLQPILMVTHKVGQTRHKLQQLAEGIVEELLELQKLCQDGQGHLNDLDPESTRSLKKLHSSVRIPFRPIFFNDPDHVILL